MSRRRKLGAALPADWHEATEASVNGRLLSPGTECSIKGERGRFRFVKAVSRDSGVAWLDFWGGPKGSEAFRSFRASQVRRVHRIPRTDKGVLDARKKAVSA